MGAAGLDNLGPRHQFCVMTGAGLRLGDLRFWVAGGLGRNQCRDMVGSVGGCDLAFGVAT